MWGGWIRPFDTYQRSINVPEEHSSGGFWIKLKHTGILLNLGFNWREEGDAIKCLVTGGAGFIGSHLTELLLSHGHQVTVVDNLSVGKTNNFASFVESPNFRFIQLDVSDFEALSNVFSGIDWVFHLAALADIVPSIENPEAYFQSNVVGSFNVAKLSAENNVKRVVYAASSSCYGIPKSFPTSEDAGCDPKYPYALTKYLGEQIMMHWNSVYDLPVVCLRLFNV